MTTVTENTSAIPAQFAAISDDGIVETYTADLSGIKTIVESHVQGVARFGNYIILTHNNKGESKGFLFVLDVTTKQMLYQFNTDREHVNHPGGIQRLGSLLAVPVETGNDTGAKSSYICFYDLTLMTSANRPVLQPQIIDRSSRGTGAVGMTSYTVNGQTSFLIAAYDNGETDFYTSDEIPGTSFDFAQFAFSSPLSDKGYSSLCLFTAADPDGNRAVYMVGFRTEKLFSTADDYMDLYLVDVQRKFVTQVQDARHMICHHGALVGESGVHFRWSAGLDIDEASGAFTVLAGQRNVLASRLAINTFKSST